MKLKTDNSSGSARLLVAVSWWTFPCAFRRARASTASLARETRL